MLTEKFKSSPVSTYNLVDFNLSLILFTLINKMCLVHIFKQRTHYTNENVFR